MLAYVYGKLYVHELGTEAEHPNVVVLWLTTDLSGLQVLVAGTEIQAAPLWQRPAFTMSFIKALKY